MSATILSLNPVNRKGAPAAPPPGAADDSHLPPIKAARVAPMPAPPPPSAAAAGPPSPLSAADKRAIARAARPRGNRDHSRMSFAASVKALSSPRLTGAQRQRALHLSAARRWLLFAVCALGALGAATGICAAQAVFWRCQLDEDPGSCPARLRDGVTDALKAVTTVSTVLLVAALAAFKLAEAEELRLVGALLPHEGLFGANDPLFFATLGLCALHCPAGIYATTTIHQYTVDIVYDYDSLLAIALAFRLFALVPLCIDEFAGMNSKTARVIERFNGVKLDVGFTVRLLVSRSPLTFSLVCFTATVLCFAFALHVAERPVCQSADAHIAGWCGSNTMGTKDFSSFANCVWNAIITALSVGYGDIFATTQLGRFIAALTGIAGAANMATLISAVSRTLTLSAAESRATRAFSRVAMQNERREVAAVVLLRFIAVALMRLPSRTAGVVGAGGAAPSEAAAAAAVVEADTSSSSVASPSSSSSSSSSSPASAGASSHSSRRGALLARLRPFSVVPRAALLALDDAVHRYKDFVRRSLNYKNDVDDVVKLQYDLVDLRENVDKSLLTLQRQVAALHALVAEQRGSGTAPQA